MRSPGPLALLLLFAAISCDSADSALPGDHTAVSFDDVFESGRVIQLRPDSSDPIGDLTALTIWRDHIVVADGFRSNVKVFRNNGSLRSTLGRTGDGPGEFRRPVALSVIGDTLLVLDADLRVSSFDSAGEYLGRFQASGSRGLAIQPLGTGDRFLLSARKVEDDGDTYGAQVIDRSGKRLSSFHPVVDVSERYRRNFLNVRAAQVGDYVVSLDQTTNRLTRTSMTGGEQEEIVLQADWYQPPRWMGDRDPIPSLRELTDWANEQMWARYLIPLSETDVLVGFSRYDRQRERADFYYLIVDTETGAQTVIREDVDMPFRFALGDTVLAARLDDMGEPIVRTFLRTSPGF